MIWHDHELSTLKPRRSGVRGVESEAATLLDQFAVLWPNISSYGPSSLVIRTQIVLHAVFVVSEHTTQQYSWSKMRQR